MEILVLGFVALVIFFVVAIVRGTEIGKFTLGLEKEFPGAKVYVSHHDTSFLVVDFKHTRIVVGLQKRRGSVLAEDEPYRAAIPFTGIVKIEVLSDNTQVASTNRGSQALGAAAGALALGGIGAVIGGLSGSSTTSSGIKRMSLRITVEDTKKPVHEVTFYETPSKKGGRRGEMFFDQAVKQIAEFGAHLDVAIRQTQHATSAPAQESTSPPSSQGMLSKEIGELWKLKELGALTEEEFKAQKVRLIGG